MQKLLIVANNCLSHYNSNGRSMLNMLGKFDSEHLSQIYISGERADTGLCKHNACISDKAVVFSYFGKKIKFTEFAGDAHEEQKPSGSKRPVKKTALTMLLRDILWDHSRGVKRATMEFARETAPDAVVLQAGDNSLLINIAVGIADGLDIPLIVHDTENYFFKEFDFMKGTDSAGPVYKRFHKRYCKAFEKMMNKEATFICNCEGLRDLYRDRFGVSGEIIYTPTDFTPTEELNNNGAVIYGGNLGVGRHRALMAIANEIHNYDKNLFVDVYGAAPNESIQNELKNANGVRFHGVISYDELCRRIRDARLLLLAESFGEFYKRDTRYAFSTKIADYCASGVPSLIFAPEQCEAAMYLKKYDAAFVVSDPTKLAKTVAAALGNEEERLSRVKNATELAHKNHDYDDNCKRFADIVDNVTKRKTT